MKANFKPWITLIAIIVIGFVNSCKINSTIIPEVEYSTKIIGSWQGTVDNSKETMSINVDSTFVCRIRPLGFLANTLSQTLPGTIHGKWKITGATITLSITGANNERVENKTASSLILRFMENELTLKSAHGETATFQRVHSL